MIVEVLFIEFVLISSQQINSECSRSLCCRSPGRVTCFCWAAQIKSHRQAEPCSVQSGSHLCAVKGANDHRWTDCTLGDAGLSCSSLEELCTARLRTALLIPPGNAAKPLMKLYLTFLSFSLWKCVQVVMFIVVWVVCIFIWLNQQKTTQPTHLKSLAAWLHHSGFVRCLSVWHSIRNKQTRLHKGIIYFLLVWPRH